MPVSSLPVQNRFDTPARRGPEPTTAPGSATLMRRYELRYLTPDHQSAQKAVVAPATPLFEAAFSAFARGTVLKTTQGPCPIEDLDPGIKVETAEHGPLPVLWRGAINILPNMPADHARDQHLTRIMAGAFGPLRPETDIMLGPAAQMLRPNTASPGHRLQPVTDLTNGDSVFQTTPPSVVQVFHICLPQQASINANGLQFASYHPGTALRGRLGPNMAQLFLSLFPHLTDFAEFGAPLRDGSERVHKADLDWV